jgi:DNA-binding response OmpR family regulator
MYHVAYLDDQESNFAVVAFKLGANFNLETFTVKEEFIDCCKAKKLDAYLIDIHLVESCGFSVSKELMTAENTKDVPVIFVSFDVSPETLKEVMVETGAEFVSKSMGPAEFKLRVESCIQNYKKRNLRLGNLLVDLQMMEVRSGEELIDVTLKELKILAHLLRCSQNKTHKSTIFQKIWGDTNVSDKTLNSHLSNLRAKLANAGVRIQVLRDGVVELVEAS